MREEMREEREQGGRGERREREEGREGERRERRRGRAKSLQCSIHC